jgi:hypothetical protein
LRDRRQLEAEQVPLPEELLLVADRRLAEARDLAAELRVGGGVAPFAIAALSRSRSARAPAMPSATAFARFALM